MASLADVVTKHDQDLYRGNGKPGLTTRTAVLESEVEAVKQDVTDIKTRQAQILVAVLATLGGVVTEIIVKFIVH